MSVETRVCKPEHDCVTRVLRTPGDDVLRIFWIRDTKRETVSVLRKDHGTFISLEEKKKKTVQ